MTIKLKDFYLFDANATAKIDLCGVYRVVDMISETHEVVLEDVETLEIHYVDEELVKRYGLEY